MIRQVNMVKGKHRLIFVFDDQRYQDLIDAVANTASDSLHGFDWYDAAELCWRAGEMCKREMTT